MGQSSDVTARGAAVSYKAILVQADESEASTQRSMAAAGLAQRFGAHLTGVFLRTSFPSRYYAYGPFGGVPPTILPNLIAEHDQAMAAASEEARGRFEAAAATAGVDSDWMVLDGDTAQEMVDCMRRTDLTVFPRDRLPIVAENGVEIAGLGLQSGGPVLVLPPGAPDARIGRRVLIAWNGSREAARALNDAWPFITEAEKVFVLTVAPHGDRGPEGLLQRRLERHGCQVEVIVERSEDASAGRVLLDQIKILGADLVVMGLYGRSRLQEMVLGGVSRDVLRSSPVPLLVSH